MKHLSILGILAIFALALNLYFAIGSNFNDFKQGFEDGQRALLTTHKQIHTDLGQK